MIRRSKRYITIVLLSAAAGAFAQEPAWVLLEKGRTAYEDRDLSAAMDALLDAVEANPEYPEAEYWLGRVFDAQGQPDLAEEQYRRAIALSVYLRVPDDEIVYLYSLAELLLNRGGPDGGEAEAILNGIAEGEAESVEDEIAKGHRYVALVAEQGLDELLYLYRDERSESLKALRMLGEKAWEEGRRRSAMLNSTQSVLSMLTTAAENMREANPDWRFDIDPVRDAENPDRDVRYPGRVDGVVELLDRIRDENAELSVWMGEEGFWPQLYLLSVSLYSNGYESAAEDIWSVLVIEDPGTGLADPRPEAGPWGRLALRQRESPFISTGALAP